MSVVIQTNKYQFWQKLATAILLFVFIFNFAAIDFALAGDAAPPLIVQNSNAAAKSVLDNAATGFLADTFLKGLNAILTASLIFLAKLVAWTGLFFDSVLLVNMSGFQDDIALINSGWTISRDVANIFFILILLVIAIATILRFETYNAKRLLPKLITVALLINFSLTFGFMIIDFGNFLAQGFYEAVGLDPALKTTGVVRMQQIFNIKAAEGSSTLNWTLGGVLGGAAVCLTASTIAAATGGAGAAAVPFACSGTVMVLGGAISGLSLWRFFSSKADLEASINYFSSVLIANIMAITLVFVFVFGGVLLLIRYATLVILLILAPIAYVAYILPDTEGRIWKKWWDTFLNNVFFFPAFMFLLYIGLTIGSAYLLKPLVGGVSNPGFLTNLVIIEVFLIGALLISRQMGIYAAGAVINMANKGRQYATGYTGALALRNTTGRIGEALGRQEWVKGNYYASRAAKGMAGYSGKGIFAKPGASRSEITSKRAEFDVAATRSKAASKQPGDFMAYTNMASKEKYVEDTLKNPKTLDEFMKNSDDNAKGEFVRVARLKGGVGGEKAFNDAKRRHQLRGLKGEDLAKHFNRADQTNDGRAEDFKAMEAGQIADLLDTQSGDEQKLKTITDTVASKFEPEKQEKFYRAAMTGSSVDTAEKVYKHVPEQMRREFALRNTERTNAIFNKMKQSGNNDADLILDDIKKSGAEERYTNAGNPNRKNWMNRLGKKAELDELEKEEKEIKETREVEKEFKKTQTELNKRALAQGKGGGTSGGGAGVGGGAPPPPMPPTRPPSAEEIMLNQYKTEKQNYINRLHSIEQEFRSNARDIGDRTPDIIKIENKLKDERNAINTSLKDIEAKINRLGGEKS